MITIGISGVAVCGLLVGLSPTYVVMALFLALMGVLGGGYHPVASPLVSASVEEKNRGRALGLHQMGGTASFVATPLIAAAIAGAVGWRGAFVSLSVPVIIFGIVLYTILGRRGYTNKLEPVTPKSYTESPTTPSGRGRLIPFIVLGVVLQVLVFSTVYWIPVFAVDQLGANEVAAASLVSLAHLVGLVAGPVGGYLSDRLGKVPLMLVVSLPVGPFIYLLSMASLGWSICVVLLAMGACQYVSMPIAEAYIISHTSERNRSTILGIYYASSRGGPAVIWIIGYLIDRFGFDTSFTIVGAALFAVTLGCSIFLWGSRD